MQVWKFAIEPATGEHRIEMPKGSKLLTIQLQHGVPVLWAICDDKATRVARKIWSYGTGDAMLRAWPYVATLQIGPAVFHYFDFGEG